MSRTLHQLNSRITGMICPRCQKRYPVGDYFFGCPACLERGTSSNLTLVYEGKSCTESPRRFKMITDIKIAPPGINACQGAVISTFLPSFII